MPSAADLAKRAARLAACSPSDAVALFDELAWETVLTSHDEDMRSGGLQRIFPTPSSSRYTAFLGEESYQNLVLRRWHEAGGGDIFKRRGLYPPPPPWVPRQISFSKT